MEASGQFHAPATLLPAGRDHGNRLMGCRAGLYEQFAQWNYLLSKHMWQ